MSREIEIKDEGKQEFAIRRTPEEIEARLEELKEQIGLNDVLIHSTYGAVQEPGSKRKLEILQARAETLQWLLGDENKDPTRIP